MMTIHSSSVDPYLVVFASYDTKHSTLQQECEKDCNQSSTSAQGINTNAIDSLLCASDVPFINNYGIPILEDAVITRDVYDKSCSNTHNQAHNYPISLQTQYRDQSGNHIGQVASPKNQILYGSSNKLQGMQTCSYDSLSTVDSRTLSVCSNNTNNQLDQITENNIIGESIGGKELVNNDHHNKIKTSLEIKNDSSLEFNDEKNAQAEITKDQTHVKRQEPGENKKIVNLSGKPTIVKRFFATNSKLLHDVSAYKDLLNFKNDASNRLITKPPKKFYKSIINNQKTLSDKLLCLIEVFRRQGTVPCKALINKFGERNILTSLIKEIDQAAIDLFIELPPNISAYNGKSKPRFDQTLDENAPVSSTNIMAGNCVVQTNGSNENIAGLDNIAKSSHEQAPAKANILTEQTVQPLCRLDSLNYSVGYDQSKDNNELDVTYIQGNQSCDKLVGDVESCNNRGLNTFSALNNNSKDSTNSCSRLDKSMSYNYPNIPEYLNNRQFNGYSSTNNSIENVVPSNQFYNNDINASTMSSGLCTINVSGNLKGYDLSSNDISSLVNTKQYRSSGTNVSCNTNNNKYSGNSDTLIKEVENNFKLQNQNNVHHSSSLLVSNDYSNTSNYIFFDQDHQVDPQTNNSSMNSGLKPDSYNKQESNSKDSHLVKDGGSSCGMMLLTNVLQENTPVDDRCGKPMDEFQKNSFTDKNNVSTTVSSYSVNSDENISYIKKNPLGSNTCNIGLNNNNNDYYDMQSNAKKASSINNVSYNMSVDNYNVYDNRSNDIDFRGYGYKYNTCDNMIIPPPVASGYQPLDGQNKAYKSYPHSNMVYYNNYEMDMGLPYNNNYNQSVYNYYSMVHSFPYINNQHRLDSTINSNNNYSEKNYDLHCKGPVVGDRPLTPPAHGWYAKYSSGVTGVVWDRVHQAWVVSWTLAGKRTFRHFTCKSYGGFDRAREAAIEFRLARNKEIAAYNKRNKSK